MKLLKMTNSLLAAHTWYRECPLSWKQRAIEDLHNILIKKYVPTEALERGISYETFVNEKLLNHQPFDDPYEKEIFEELYDAKQQGWISALKLNTSFGLFIFRGKYDFKINNTRIYDLKTTVKEIKKEKYIKSFQHSIYGLAENIPNFTYLIVRLGKRFHPLEVERIDLSLDFEIEKQRLVDEVERCCLDLKELGFLDDYENLFQQ
jgi:hypothetical protein